MITVQEVFDMAIHLMDEQSETNGTTLTTDTQEYKYRTISILNTIMPALYPYSDNYDSSGNGRPVCPMLQVTAGENGANHAKPDFAQVIPLDDTLALGVLPYGLAAHLLSGENVELSAWFLSRYNQAFADLRSKIPGTFEPIATPYGLF